MQLSGLLDKLRGFFTPAFLISAVLPLLCFILVNAAVLAQFNPAVDGWVNSYLANDLSGKTIVAAISSLALIVAAYILSTLNLTLRQILEGEKLRSKWIESWLLTSETARLDGLRQELNQERESQRVLLGDSPIWISTLQEARKNVKDPNTCKYSNHSDAHLALHALDQKRWHDDLIPPQSVEHVVNLLEKALTENSADLADDNSKLLNDDQEWFVDNILKYIQQRAEKDYIRLFNEREFNFSRFSLAPTRMGNVARSVDSYAQSRYHINLVFFWTRLQKALQGKAEYYKTVQDAKTQLDFTVSLFWLTVLSIMIWLCALPFLTHTWLPLIIAWAVGPLLARGCYQLGIQNYVVFADLLRSSLDLFRFDLLADLKMPLPKDGRSEKQMWEQLNKRMGYGEDSIIAYKQE